MATVLELKISGLDKLGGAGASGGLSQSLKKLEQIGERLGQSMERGFRRGETAAERLRRQRENNESRLARQRERLQAASSRQSARLSQREVAERRRAAIAVAAIQQRQGDLNFRREQTRIRQLERLEAAAIRRNARRRQSALRGVGRGARGFGSIAGGAGSIVGGIGGGIGGAFSGGGSFAGGIVRGAGAIGGGALSGAGGALGGIPIIGGALSGVAQAGGGVLRAASQLGGQIADSIMGAVKVGLVAGLGVTVVAAVKAVKLDRAETSFRSYAEAVGVDAKEALQGFREATFGAVADTDLLTGFMRAQQLQAVKNVGEFESLSRSAVLLGQAMGRSPKEALEDLSLGFGRQSRLILDNLGIIISARSAYQDYAREVGKSVSALTESERRTAFQSAATEALTRNQSKLGKLTGTTAFKFAQFQASMSNLLATAGKPLLALFDRMLPTLKSLADRFSEWLSSKREVIANKITTALDGMLTVIEKIDQGFGSKKADEFFERLKTGSSEAAKEIGKGLSAIAEAFGIKLKSEALIALSEPGHQTKQVGRAFLDFFVTGAGNRKKGNSLVGDAERERQERVAGERRAADALVRNKRIDASRSFNRAGEALGGIFNPPEPRGLLTNLLVAGRGAAKAILVKVENALEIAAAAGGGGGGGTTPGGLRAPPVGLLAGLNKAFRPGALESSIARALAPTLGRIASASSFGLAGPGIGRLPQVAASTSLRPGFDLKRGVGLLAADAGLPQETARSIVGSAGGDVKKLRALEEVLESVVEEKRIREEILRLTSDLRTKIETSEKRVASLAATKADHAKKAADAERDIRAAVETRKRLELERADLEARHWEAREDLIKRITESLERAEETIKDTFAGRLAGLGGTFSDRRSTPRNIRQGEDRAAKFEARAEKEFLKRKYGHLSAGEIARSPRIRAEIRADRSDFRERAAEPLGKAIREVTERRAKKKDSPLGEDIADARGKAAEELKVGLDELKASRDEALAEMKAEKEALDEFITSSLDEAAEEKALHESTTKTLEEAARVLADQKEEIAANRKVIEKLFDAIAKINKGGSK